jgi:hypothetical protein
MAKSSTDHAEIRRWAERHGGRPATVKRTHRDATVGIIRIMFPDAPRTKHEELDEISWDDFFRQFDEAGLVLLYEEESNFNKLVRRATLERRTKHEGSASHRSPSR